MYENFKLTGKVAIVTGAGQGLGKSFALALSAAGAEVFLMARNISRLQKTASEISSKTNNPTHAFQLDITDEKNIEEACTYVKKCKGHIDILVNNAAVGRSDQTLIDESLEEWNAIIGTNLTGTFLMMKHVGRIMIEQNYGKIINLASMSGLIVNRNPTVGAYDVSKAGVQCLTRIMAATWAEHNINVNSICPGYYMTDINKDYVKKHPDFYEDSLNQIPIRNWGNPENIGDIAVFLSSSASDYMTGANLVTDGGYTLW